MRRRRGVSRERRIAAALPLLAFVGLQLGAVVHELRVEHVRCAEHGELVDRPSALATTDEVAEPGITADRREAHSAHEHCDLVMVHRTPTLLVAAPSLAAGSDVGACNDVVTTAKHDPIDVVFLAPKTSPPTLT